jgi:hypothetical protein
MRATIFQSFSLIDVSGYAIIATILALMSVGMTLTFVVRARYQRMARDLGRGAQSGRFDSDVLNAITLEARDALQRHPGEVNTQAIIDHAFQARLGWILIGERFIKATTSLLVILGLVGTFYGLTLSIGKLAALVSGDVQDPSAITQSLTAGLTQALTGMSVAFSTSLFGILAAIVMTLLSVFFNVIDRRNELMAQIEAFLDNTLRAAVLASGAWGPGAGSVAAGRGTAGAPLDHTVIAFGQTIARLEGAVAQFGSALATFAGTTRDFQEFNLHLKDNVQRMSLSFGDLSDTLKDHARAFKARA